MKSYKNILAVCCLAGSLIISGNITGNVARAQEQAAANLPNASLTVQEAEKYVKNDKLYQTVAKLPPITEKMEALNALCVSIVKTKELNLVVLDTREAISEKSIRAGYPASLFHAIDTANSIPQKVGSNIVTGSHKFIFVQNKNAKRSLGVEPLVYIKNTANGNISRVDLEATEKAKKQLASLEDFLKAPQISITKNSREFNIAQMVFQTAEQNKAKAK